MHGFLIYDTATDSYNLTQTVVETGATSYQNVRCQWGKKYKLPYVCSTCHAQTFFYLPPYVNILRVRLHAEL